MGYGQVVQMMRGRMTDQTGIEWPTCDEDGCIGVRRAAARKCLAHSKQELDAALKQLGETVRSTRVAYRSHRSSLR
jgi:hypothetical protein